MRFGAGTVGRTGRLHGRYPVRNWSGDSWTDHISLVILVGVSVLEGLTTTLLRRGASDINSVKTPHARATVTRCLSSHSHHTIAIRP